MSSTFPVYFLFLILVFNTICTGNTTRNGTRDESTIDIELYYTANSQKDADFVVSQLAAELKDPQYPHLIELALSSGGGITIDENGNCQAETSGLCETSLLHFCVFRNYMSEQVKFLECYFQSEFFPFDLLKATEQCAKTILNENAWHLLNTCASETDTISAYAEAVLRAQSFRPIIRETPYVLINKKYDNLAAVDLRKALCRSQAIEDEEEGGIWECESVDKYKEPKVEIFYLPYSENASIFFDRFTQSEYDLVQSAALLLSIVPNPNYVLDCPANYSCWNYQAHWCAHENTAIETHQLDFIRCTFQNASTSRRTDQELVKECLPEGYYEEYILPCIEDIASSAVDIQLYKDQINALIDSSEQTSLEFIIQGQSNVKAKNGLLEELCYNYFHTDNENFGCKVRLPKVQIFYESPSAYLDDVLLQHLKQFDQFSPFDEIMELGLVPYGRTTVGQDGAYICSGGADFCKVNWLQACLLKIQFSDSVDKYLALQFIACSSIPTASPVDTAKECFLKVYPKNDGESLWANIEECAANDATLKEELRNKTEAIDLKQVPEVVVDNVKKTTEVGKQLLVYLCRSFKPIKPRVCLEIDSESTQFVMPVEVFFHGDSGSTNFMTIELKSLLEKELRDHRIRLRDVIEWHFVPWGPSQYNASIGEISCAGGQVECLINTVLACATQQRQNGLLGAREERQRVANFLVCFFDFDSNWRADPLRVASQCSQHLSLGLDSYPQLWQCVTQKERRTEVMLRMKASSDRYPNIGKWPSVVIGGEVNFDINSLVAVLCANYKASPRPVECAELDQTTTPSTGPGGSAFSATALTKLSLIFVLLLLHFCSLQQLL